MVRQGAAGEGGAVAARAGAPAAAHAGVRAPPAAVPLRHGDHGGGRGRRHGLAGGGPRAGLRLRHLQHHRAHHARRPHRPRRAAAGQTPFHCTVYLLLDIYSRQKKQNNYKWL